MIVTVYYIVPVIKRDHAVILTKRKKIVFDGHNSRTSLLLVMLDGTTFTFSEKLTPFFHPHAAFSNPWLLFLTQCLSRSRPVLNKVDKPMAKLVKPKSNYGTFLPHWLR